MSDETKTEKTETVHPGRALNEVLKRLIAAAPEEFKGALPVQVILRNGLGMNGAVRRHPDVEDVYIMSAAVTDQQGRPTGISDVYFHGHDIARIDQRIESSGPDLSLPAGMAPMFGKIPGLGGRR